jgi:hypothetical protein
MIEHAHRTRTMPDATCLADAIRQAAVNELDRGFRPIVLYPAGAEHPRKPAPEGKEPFGPKWGVKDVSPETLAADFRRFTKRGQVAGLGPASPPDAHLTTERGDLHSCANDLADVVHAWLALPGAVGAGIVAMVRAASRQGGGA